MGVFEIDHDVKARKSRTAIDLVLDWVERLLVAGIYGFLVARIVMALKPQEGLASLLVGLPLLLSEGLVVVFVLLRRPAIETSRRPLDWLLASGATCAPLLVVYPASQPTLPMILVGTSVWLVGLIVQVHAKLIMRWSIGCVPAHRGLVQAGPYQFVRHPMYAGYMLSHMGFLVMNPTFWNLSCYLLSDGVLQIPRILAEERLLSRDPRYRDYRDLVRYRLFPGLF